MLATAMQIAVAMAGRSEDPYNKVGAVAMTADNRVIATACNGLLPGKSIFDLAKFGDMLGDWTGSFRDCRLPFMVHAEQNLCSLLRRGEATTCVTTLQPCASCTLLLAVHGFKKIVYLEPYVRDNRSELITNFYELELRKFEDAKEDRSR